MSVKGSAAYQSQHVMTRELYINSSSLVHRVANISLPPPSSCRQLQCKLQVSNLSLHPDRRRPALARPTGSATRAAPAEGLCPVGAGGPGRPGSHAGERATAAAAARAAPARLLALCHAASPRRRWRRLEGSTAARGNGQRAAWVVKRGSAGAVLNP